MLFALICKDKPGALNVRMETRPKHVEFINGLIADRKLAFAGPFLEAEGKSIGSLVMIEAAGQAEAEAVAASDPYARAGLFDSVEVLPWTWVFNKPADA
jgi:uncharacterized protein YciI